MYKILHIPSGQYLYNGYGKIMLFATVIWAEDEIDNVSDCLVALAWNKYNRNIGWPVSKDEFEILEADDV